MASIKLKIVNKMMMTMMMILQTDADPPASKYFKMTTQIENKSTITDDSS
jgi:hypothetical protein